MYRDQGDYYTSPGKGEEDVQSLLDKYSSRYQPGKRDLYIVTSSTRQLLLIVPCRIGNQFWRVL